jgi:hypothetical protein
MQGMTEILHLHQTVLLLLIIACLGPCLVRAVWELEQMRTRRITAAPRRRARERD